MIPKFIWNGSMKVILKKTEIMIKKEPILSDTKTQYKSTATAIKQFILLGAGMVKRLQ